MASEIKAVDVRHAKGNIRDVTMLTFSSVFTRNAFCNYVSKNDIKFTYQDGTTTDFRLKSAYAKPEHENDLRMILQAVAKILINKTSLLEWKDLELDNTSMRLTWSPKTSL